MRSPLVPLHNAIYTLLDTNVTSAGTYSFVPNEPVYPYVFIERKDISNGGGNKARSRHNARVKLIVATNSKDINELQGIVDEVEQAFTLGLTLSDNWSVVSQSDIPDVGAYPAQHFDGSQGHAAEIFYTLTLLDTQ